MKWALALLCLILLAPLALVDMPPLLDYPNHLARAVVLAFGRQPIRSCRACTRRIGRSSPISAPTSSCRRCCMSCPSIWPAASLWACAILLPVIGTIAYSRAMFGAYSAWPLASGLVAYNATLLLGFLNFVAAIGIALLLAAGWIAWRDRHPAPHRGAGNRRHGRAVLLPPDGAAVLLCADRRVTNWNGSGSAARMDGRSGTARRPCAAVRRLARPLPGLAARAARRRKPNSHPPPTRRGNWSFRLPTTSCRSTSSRPAWSARSSSAARQSVAAASRRARGVALLLTALSFWRPHGRSREPISSTPAS